MGMLVVLRHHGLGDLLTAQPALRALKRAFPEHDLVSTCPSWLLALAEYLGTADRWIAESQEDINVGDPTRHQDVDKALLRNLLKQIDKCDMLVSMRTPGPELIPIIASLAPNRVVSYRYPELLETIGFPYLDFSDHILLRWRRLLSPLGVDPNDADLEISIETATVDAGATVVHCGAGSPSRCWPAERWVAIIRRLIDDGQRVLLTGSLQEESATIAIAIAADLPTHNLRCHLDSLELARLIAGARLVICTDTGVSHLATATGTPAVTLFGPVPPNWWGPPAGYDRHLTLWNGKTGDNYSFEVDPGLLDISVEQVLVAIGKFENDR